MIFNSETFRNYLVSSSAYSLIMYMANEITKEFWKNSNFENTRAGFLLTCQNSLRQTGPEMMHFQAWKKEDFNQYYVVAFHPIKMFTY